MTALDFIWNRFPHLPMMMNGNLPVKMSKSELRRTLDSGSVLINGKKPKWSEEVELPIWQFIWFPKNDKKRTTWMDKL